jgi:hypothetical protein
MGLTKKLLDEQYYKDAQYDLEYDEYLHYLLKGSEKSKEKKTLYKHIRTFIQITMGGFKNLRTFRIRKDSKRRISRNNRGFKFAFSKKRNLF